jgi:nucleotide-binding universal stress UspA family protein
MADDVKVKFGGDFTDVPKGAEAAANAAGTQLKSWFNQGMEGIMSSIGSALSMHAIFDKIKENVEQANEYFKELNHSIRTTGASGDEFQRIAYLGKSVGVTMESVGRAMGFFAKNMGAASKDAHGHGKILQELGFTNEQITSGNISATEVLAALADQFKKTGNEALLASNTMSLFGRGGREMLPIIQKGKDAILEQAKALKVYSDAELEAAEASERASERKANAWKKLWKEIALTLDKAESRRVVINSIEDLQHTMTKEGKDYKGANKKEYGERLVKDLESKGVGLAFQEEVFKQMQKNYSPGRYRPFSSEAFKQTFDSINEALEKAKKEAKPEEAKKETTSNAIALAASSLQQIGGGDVSSILAGSTTQDLVTYAKITSENTTKLVNENNFKPATPTNQAK